MLKGRMNYAKQHADATQFLQAVETGTLKVSLDANQVAITERLHHALNKTGTNYDVLPNDSELAAGNEFHQLVAVQLIQYKIPEYLSSGLTALFGRLFQHTIRNLDIIPGVWPTLFYIIIGLCLLAQDPANEDAQAMINTNVTVLNIIGTSVRPNIGISVQPETYELLKVFVNYSKFIITGDAIPLIGGRRGRLAKKVAKKSKKVAKKSKKTRRHA